MITSILAPPLYRRSVRSPRFSIKLGHSKPSFAVLPASIRWICLNLAALLPSTLDNALSEVHHGPVYTDFFGLAELPFRMTPDPRFLWHSHTHREAKAKILHHLQTRKGPVYLFADVGTGKTSLAKRIHDELREDQSKQVVFAFAPNLKTSNLFLRFVMEQFGVKTDRNHAASLMHFEQSWNIPETGRTSAEIVDDPAEWYAIRYIRYLIRCQIAGKIQPNRLPSNLRPVLKNFPLTLEQTFYTISSPEPPGRAVRSAYLALARSPLTTQHACRPRPSSAPIGVTDQAPLWVCGCAAAFPRPPPPRDTSRQIAPAAAAAVTNFAAQFPSCGARRRCFSRTPLYPRFPPMDSRVPPTRGSRVPRVPRVP